MVRKDYEDAREIACKIREVDWMRQIYPVTMDTAPLKSKLDAIHTQFEHDMMAEGVDCELARFLDLYYFKALKHKEIQQYECYGNRSEGYSRKLINRYFSDKVA